VSKTWKPPEDIDPECVPLCAAMNRVPGIQTIESCCGHGKDPFRVWFVATSLDRLPDLLYWFDGCHSGFYDWKVTVATDCAKSPVHFKVEGPAGAFSEADSIAALIADVKTS